MKNMLNIHDCYTQLYTQIILNIKITGTETLGLGYKRVEKKSGDEKGKEPEEEQGGKRCEAVFLLLHLFGKHCASPLGEERSGRSASC